jgi:hypothetical protein
MTPKEAYEARKAERKSRPHDKDHEVKESEMVDLFDRMATAFERIAEALEKRP